MTLVHWALTDAFAAAPAHCQEDRLSSAAAFAVVAVASERVKVGHYFFVEPLPVILAAVTARRQYSPYAH